MKISEMHWKQVEDYLKHDDRGVLPIGSTEQHCELSLSVDSILAERVALEAAEPLRVPVFPVLPYGITPYFMAYPGTVTLTAETHGRVLREIIDCLATHGFKRIVVVNGHGGNSPGQAIVEECMRARPEIRVKFHNWWNAPATWAKVKEIDPVASHASWMENFPWTRLAGVAYPAQQKTPIDVSKLHSMSPPRVREYIGDGNFAGVYQKPDEQMLALWKIGVEETRKAIASGWE
ncbi:MAG: creatininase family protein [Candidatus Acidiferrales bacterium]